MRCSTWVLCPADCSAVCSTPRSTLSYLAVSATTEASVTTAAAAMHSLPLAQWNQANWLWRLRLHTLCWPLCIQKVRE